MEPSKLLHGNTYYRLTFADPDLTMPGVEPLVFIGTTHPKDDNEMYCFQDTVSYVRFGKATEYRGEEELGVVFVPENDLASIYNLDGIATEILNATNRAKKCGEPCLKHVKGPWV